VKVETHKPDDPEFARYIGGTAARVSIPADALPPPPYSPRFGDYVAGRVDAPAEEREPMAERATEDEVVTLPDGRQVQIKAKGAPVNEKLAERERDLVQRSINHDENADPLREIRPDGETRAVGTGVRDEATVRPLTGEADVREASPTELAKTSTKAGARGAKK